MHRKFKFVSFSIFIVALTIGLLVACGKPQHKVQNNIPLSDTQKDIRIEFHASYIQLSTEEMTDQADVIFVGKIASISPTLWNQDSGEYWDKDKDDLSSPLPLHHIEIDIVQPIVDVVGLERRVVITVLGNSPLDQTVVYCEGSDCPKADHNLEIDDQAFIFARQTELAWRDGTRTILQLMGVPNDSYLVLGDDGRYNYQRDGLSEQQAVTFEYLVNQVAEKREILIQP